MEEGIWMPVSHEFNADISIMGVKARATYTSAVKYLEVEPDRSLAVPSAYTAVTDDENQPEVKTPVQKEIEVILSKDELTARDMSRLARLNEKNAVGSRENHPWRLWKELLSLSRKTPHQKDSAYWNKMPDPSR
ncbi:MAG: hypothetical protein U5L72_14000 [Bacteroidales bacterium]|nr:hypothetical protein [Bacteroidales bacterium]